MGFSRKESWSGLPCPPPGDLPDPGTEPPSLTSLAFAGRFSTNSATWDVHYPSGRTTGESWTSEEQQLWPPQARWDQRPTQGQRQGRGRGRGGRKRNAQTWINEITVTAAAGSLGEEEPPEHLPSHRGNSNMADMGTWRVYADGLELPAADARARSRAKGLRVGQGLPRTPAGKTKNAETRCLEP